MTFPYGTEVYHVGGCFRFDPAGIYLHENDKHGSIGIKSFGLNGVFFRIYWEKAAPIFAIDVSVDETIGGKFGAIAGGSGGAAYIDVAVFDTRLGRRLNLSDPADYARIADSNANLWIDAKHIKVPGTGSSCA